MSPHAEESASPTSPMVGVSPPTKPRERTATRAWATFWCDFLFWWTAHAPRVVLWTSPMFLAGAYRLSSNLRDGPVRNARRLLGTGATEAEVETLRRDIVRQGYLSVYELGMCLKLDKAALLARIEGVEGRERYERARRSATGAILVSAHCGPFELGVAALVEQEKRIHILFQRDERSSFERLRSDFRKRLGVVEAPVEDGWNVWVGLRDALLADEVVVMQGDRVMPGQRGVKMPFLGGHVELPPGPVKLAMATGAPIVPIFSIRTRIGHVRLVIGDPISVERRAAPVGPDHPAMVRMAAAIEQHVRRYPAQWTMYHRVWCEDRDQS